jgi:hypothetical protein
MAIESNPWGPAMADARPRPYSRPVFDQELTLRTEPALRVIARGRSNRSTPST